MIEYEPLYFTSVNAPGANRQVYDTLMDTVGWFDETFTRDSNYQVGAMAGSSDCGARAIFGERSAFATSEEPDRAVDFLLHADARSCGGTGWHHQTGNALARVAVVTRGSGMRQQFDVELLSSDARERALNGALIVRAAVYETVRHDQAPWQGFNGETRMSWQQPVTSVEQLGRHMEGMQQLVLGRLTVAGATDRWITGEVTHARLPMPRGRLSHATQFRA